MATAGEGGVFSWNDTSESESECLSEPPSSSPSPFQGQQREDRGVPTRGFIRAVVQKICSDKVSGSASEAGPGDYQVYPRRWFLLATLCLLNLSNGMMWLTFAPIPNYTAVLYDVGLDEVDWFSISYFVVSLLTGFVAIAILGGFGLRVALYIGAGFNLLGSVLRWISVAPVVLCSSHYPRTGYLVAMLGQVLTACAQPFLLYAPTKLAALWFGPKERALCTMLASMGNPVGLGLAQLISTNVVTQLERFVILHLIYTLPAVIGSVCTLVAFWHSRPPLPPAPSAHKDPTTLLQGLKQALTTPSFLLLLGIWGCSSGLFNAMLTLLPQMLCPYGYSDRDSGLWGALMIFCGLVGATCGGLLIDYFKLFKEVAVVSFSAALLCLTWFLEVFSLSGQPVNIAFSLCLFGFFALPLIPACMELGVEVTYPVSEATSSGLLWTMTQVMGIIFTVSGQQIPHELPETVLNQCGVGNISSMTSIHCRQQSFNSTMFGETVPSDFTYTLVLYLSVGVVTLFALAALFRPEYKRLALEHRAKQVLSRLQDQEVITPSSSIASLPREHLKADQTSAIKMLSSLKKSYQTSTEL